MTDELVNLYNLRAHVFQVNPETKNTWLTKGDSAIPVSFVSRESQDGLRELRLIGTSDDNETVLDCAILPTTDFKKRSQKFGQWNDSTGMTYGLGFNSETDLDDFINVFQQLQRDILAPSSSSAVQTPQQHQQPQQVQLQQTNLLPSHQSGNTTGRDGASWRTQTNNLSEMNGRDFNTSTGVSSRMSTAGGGDMSSQAATSNVTPTTGAQYSNTLAHPGHQQVRRSQQVPLSNNVNTTSEHESNNNTNGQNGNGPRYPRSQSMFGMQQQSQQKPSGSSTTPDETLPASTSEWLMRDQLTYENEQLKKALEESSKNAGIWQTELLNLRTNNAKLTQALLESKAHVREWEKELFGLRDENKELKLRVMALESTQDPEKTEQYKHELSKYKQYIDEVQSELRKKEEEVEGLQRSMEQLEINNNKTNGAPNGRSPDDPTLVETAISLHQKQRFDTINARLETKISELRSIQKEYAQLADKLYH